MKFEVMGDRVLLEKTGIKANADEGIFVPESIEKKFVEASVVGVGPDVKTYQSGDKVFLSKMSGFHFKYDGKEYIMVAAAEVLAKLKD
jgi:co-chaperonin GroES (HSP10)